MTMKNDSNNSKFRRWSIRAKFVAIKGYEIMSSRSLKEAVQKKCGRNFGRWLEKNKSTASFENFKENENIRLHDLARSNTKDREKKRQNARKRRFKD